jgi:undecaprenyl-diphosphatase
MTRLQKLTAYDTRLFHWCQMLHRELRLAPVSRFVSRLGDGLFYLLLGLGLALFEPEQGPAFFQAGLLAFSLELPLYLLLKNTIRRDRPRHRLDGIRAVIEPSDTFSFPSGHAAAAFLFALLLSAHYPGMAPLAFPIAGLIGLSRVLLGVHYPTDIAAGALLGLGSGVLALHLWESI